MNASMTSREVIEFLATKVMGWHESSSDWANWEDSDGEHIDDATEPWNPLEVFGEAWDLVGEVQRQNPGWRFSLLGGDSGMGYFADGYGNPLKDLEGNFVPDTKSSIPYGWHAEFFGDADPRKCTGQRHGEAHGETAQEAICKAIVKAYGDK